MKGAIKAILGIYIFLAIAAAIVGGIVGVLWFFAVWGPLWGLAAVLAGFTVFGALVGWGDE